MTIKIHSIPFLFLFFCSYLFSQELEPKLSIIEFNNGTIKHVRLSSFAVDSKSGNDKIESCKKPNRDCEKYPIVDIKKVTLYPSESLLEQYKKLVRKNPDMTYNEDDLIRYYKVVYYKEIPHLCQYVYIGKNYEFYKYVSMKSRISEWIFVTKSNNNIVEHRYEESNHNKRNLERLSRYFGNCDSFMKVANINKIYKNHGMTYFYELANECKNLK